MTDLATVEGIKDWVLALLQDVGEINRRLDALERWREETEKRGRQ